MIININIPVGEAVDRLSILMIKEKYIKDEAKLQFIETEINELIKALKPLGDYSQHLNDLIEINEKMWHCNDIRKNKIINNEFDAEYISLTVEESTVNDQRFVVKNKVNMIYNSSLREQKSYSWVT